MEAKSLIKKLIIRILIILVAAALCHIAADLVQDHTFSETLDLLPGDQGTVTTDTIRFHYYEEGIIEITDYSADETTIHITVKGLQPGTCLVEVLGTGDDILCSADYKVTPLLTVVDNGTGNYTLYRVHLIITMICLLLLCVGFWLCFREVLRTLQYSYLGIFICGFAIWLTAVTLNFVYAVVSRQNMLTILNDLSGAEYTFITYSLPFLLIFTVSLTVSNIELIRHERARFQNLLGIILSFLIVLGVLLPFAADNIFNSGSDLQLHAVEAILNVYGAAYVLLECFLLGSVICGTIAARHDPAMDKDYIIILGCKIRKDGTLYPLIRGRVDRALKFYQDQLAATGRAAVFIPSGGQGSDEVISEAEGMKRYLLEQGIPESQILVEDQSKNTLENMRFSRKLIEDRTPGAKAAFSTTNYHVFRSGIISRQAGFAPEGMGGKTKWYFWPNAYIRECLGMVVYTKKLLILTYIPIAVAFAVLPFLAAV